MEKPFPLYIHASSIASAMGATEKETLDCINGKTQPNLQLDDQCIIDPGASTVFGKLTLPLDEFPTNLEAYSSRNNRLLYHLITQIEEQVKSAIQRFGTDRVAVIIGTSTSGISDGEEALKNTLTQGEIDPNYNYSQQELGNSSEFIAQYLGITGPCFSISTACSSSGRVFLSAKRLLQSGMVDAAIVGGADTLCYLATNGFYGLEALSSKRCTPFDAQRSGISIGEAGALMLIEKEKPQQKAIAILGIGDSSDAHHISAPHPEGVGAQAAMQKALLDADLTIDDIGYINAHGTATKLNDAMEAKAIFNLFGNSTPVSSTKHLTGHTLGAASVIEATIAYLILKNDLQLPIQAIDNKSEDFNINLIQEATPLSKRFILSNSFAFGGNNISLILGDMHATK